MRNPDTEEPAVIRAIARWAALAAFAAFLSLPARAEPVAAADARGIRAVVQAQLDAFAADDAKRAFSYAAPTIRDMFGSADNFLAMVRAGYPAVYRPAAVLFLKPERIAGEIVQGVQITDSGGALWLAIYRVERQADASWRIAGCELQQASGKMT